jgi:hypothetical protein
MAGELVQYDSDLEWRSLLIGRGTPYEITTLTGWDGAPAPRHLSADRPGRHGALPGELRAGLRIIEADIQIGHIPLSTDAFRAARSALRAALAWDENPVEEPLVVMLDGVATQVSARVMNFEIPTENQYDQGYQTAAIQWAASDPRRYSVTLQQASTGLPSASSSGIAFPIAFPIDFGPGQAGGTIVLTNSGNTPTWPIFEITGPVTGPVITDTETGRAIRFNTGFEIVTGQTLRIDSDLGTVSIGPVSRRNELAAADWFPIPAGTSRQIRFTATAGTGQLTGYARDAYMT